MNKKPDDKKRSVMIGFMVTEDMARQLRLLAAREETTMSTIVYEMVEDYLTYYNNHDETSTP